MRCFLAAARRDGRRAGRTDLVVLYEVSEAPCSEPAADGGPEADLVRLVHTPPDVVANLSATGLGRAAYRLMAFGWWLRRAETRAAGYAYVGALDTDMIFQLDIIDVLAPFITAKGDDGSPMSGELHLIAENPAELNGAFTIKRMLLSKRHTCAYKRLAPMPPTATAHCMGVRRCMSGAVDGFWSTLGQTPALNLGTVFGTLGAMQRMLDALGTELLGRGAGCWDQGILNVLVWTGAITAARVVVWDYYEGPVKTLDVGAVRDRYGRFLNERGQPYAIVHQFKPHAHAPFLRELSTCCRPRACHGARPSSHPTRSACRSSRTSRALSSGRAGSCCTATCTPWQCAECLTRPAQIGPCRRRHALRRVSRAIARTLCACVLPVYADGPGGHWPPRALCTLSSTTVGTYGWTRKNTPK